MPGSNGHRYMFAHAVVWIGILAAAPPADADDRPSPPHGIYSISRMEAIIKFKHKTRIRISSCGEDARKLLLRYRGLDITYRGSVKLGGLGWRVEPGDLVLRTEGCTGASCSEKYVMAYHPDPPRGTVISVMFRRTREGAYGAIDLDRIRITDTDKVEVTCSDGFTFWGNYRRL